ncbi:unnamed protein product [Prunus armeniaca]
MHDLINNVDRYASLLKEEVQKKMASKGTYYRNPVVSYAETNNPAEVEGDEVEMRSAEVSIDKPFVCKGLVKADNSRTKIPDAKFATRETKAYTFDLTRAKAIFDLLLTEKKAKLSFGHKISKPEELKGKTFCKYHNEKKLQFPKKAAIQVDSKPFPPPVINIVNAQLRAEYKEVRRPKKRKEPLAGPELVPCSRCNSEIGRPIPSKNKRKEIEPSRPAMRKFGSQYDRWPARRAVFDRLGARGPSTSAGHKDGAAPRPMKTFKPPVVQDDRWYHARPRASAEPLTKTQLRRMQRQALQARVQTAQVEGLKRQN